jgi:hypothetical protein
MNPTLIRSAIALVAAAGLAYVSPVVVGSQAPAPSPTAPAEARTIDPKADDAMKKMSAFLAGQKTFTLEAEETFDAEFARAYRIQLTNVRTLTVERPSRFAASATGDILHRASWYDGKSLTVLNRKRNVYASLEMPGTIDAVLDKLATDYEVVLPLSDLLYADPYPTMMGGVLYGKHLGTHLAAGVACHHLTFGQEGVEWQIWIDAGAQPLPRKLTIAYWDQPAVPQYQAVFRRWTLDVKVKPDQFVFRPPTGATRVELRDLEEIAVSGSADTRP